MNPSGYCDPTAVFNDIEPRGIPQSTSKKCASTIRTPTMRQLEAYSKAEKYTSEVVYFFEQVTGHLIPDMRPALPTA